VGQKLSDARKQPVLIDNRAGAGGNVGADVVAKSPPDGYTFLITTPCLAISPLSGLLPHIKASTGCPPSGYPA
jgi:tripartite-type tricarboxylate transporter receptor subunit TctC